MASDAPTRCEVCKTTHRPSERPHERFRAYMARERRREAEYSAEQEPFQARLRQWELDQRHRSVPADAEAVAYAAMLLRDPCAYCGTHDGVGIDHITPIVFGGTSVWSNLAAVCPPCNSMKRRGNVLQTVHRCQFKRLRRGRVTVHRAERRFSVPEKLLGHEGTVSVTALRDLFPEEQTLIGALIQLARQQEN